MNNRFKKSHSLNRPHTSYWHLFHSGAARKNWSGTASIWLTTSHSCKNHTIHVTWAGYWCFKLTQFFLVAMVYSEIRAEMFLFIHSFYFRKMFSQPNNIFPDALYVPGGAPGWKLPALWCNYEGCSASARQQLWSFSAARWSLTAQAQRRWKTLAGIRAIVCLH